MWDSLFYLMVKYEIIVLCCKFNEIKFHLLNKTKRSDSVSTHKKTGTGSYLFINPVVAAMAGDEYQLILAQVGALGFSILAFVIVLGAIAGWFVTAVQRWSRKSTV